MELLLPLLASLLVATGIFLMLSRAMIRLIIGLSVFAYGVNLSLFLTGGMETGAPPLLNVQGPYRDPLPQALILTAIVIGFGLLAFTLVLVYRANQELGTVDPDEMRLAEPPFEEALEQGSVAQDPVKQGVSG
ncbi:hypothetical protein BH24DEI1_BH24DEI1_18340 [soil metagenome]